MQNAGLLILAQLGNLRDPFESITDEDAWEILVGFGWLFAAAFALLICALVARKWLKRTSFDASPLGGNTQFTLQELRHMRDQHMMTPEEFEKAKAILVAKGKSELHKQPAEENDLPILPAMDDQDDN